MNVTSLELSKELYEVSGWRTKYVICDVLYSDVTGGANWKRSWDVPWEVCNELGQENGYDFIAPTYRLGFLLRKLQSQEYAWGSLSFMGDVWTAEYEYANGFKANADTPENAAAKLIITLFEQGLLQK